MFDYFVFPLRHAQVGILKHETKCESVVFLYNVKRVLVSVFSFGKDLGVFVKKR